MTNNKRGIVVVQCPCTNNGTPSTVPLCIGSPKPGTGPFAFQEKHYNSMYITLDEKAKHFLEELITVSGKNGVPLYEVLEYSKKESALNQYTDKKISLESVRKIDKQAPDRADINKKQSKSGGASSQ